VSLNVLPPAGTAPPRRAAPSLDALGLIVSSIGYLLVVCFVVLVTSVVAIAGGVSSVPSAFFDDRDLIALFGWVGMMISGVSVIIIPNHLGVRLRPLYLPRVHLVLSNVGLVGFFGTSLLVPGSAAPEAFLGLVSISFLFFGLGVLATVVPFIPFFLGRPEPGSAAQPNHRTIG
jgi:hypothetical protein